MGKDDKKEDFNPYNYMCIFDLLADLGFVALLVTLDVYSVSCHNRELVYDFQILRRTFLMPFCFVMACTIYSCTDGINKLIFSDMKYPHKSFCRSIYFMFMGVQILADPLFISLNNDRALNNASMLVCLPPVNINPNGLYIGGCIVGVAFLLGFYAHLICAIFQVEVPKKK